MKLKLILSLLCIILVAGWYTGMLEPVRNQGAVLAYTIIEKNGFVIGGTCAGTTNISQLNGINVQPAPPYLGKPPAVHSFGTVAGSYSMTYSNWGAAQASTVACSCDATYTTWFSCSVNATTLAPCAVGTATFTYTTAGQTTNISGGCNVSYAW
jgi:hypothetical protein